MSSILHHRKRIVLLTVAVTTLATVALTMSQTKIYAATESVVVQSPPLETPAATPNMATELQIARSLAVARLVDRNLGLGISPSRLLRDLSVRVPVDSDVLKFTYSSPVPEVAQRRAQAFAEAYAAFRQSQFADQVLASASSIRQRINVLTRQLAVLANRVKRAPAAQEEIVTAERDAVATQIGLLQRKLTDLNGQGASFSPASVLGPPPLPHSPAKPNLVLNTILALFSGLLLGFGLAAVLEYFDDRIRGTQDLQARLGAPVLGLIPRENGARKFSATLSGNEVGPDRAEALRRLRANFLVAATNAGKRSVAVTTIGARDHGLDLAADLAVGLAATGRRVVLVSTRTGQPRLEEVFDLPPGAGFFDALAKEVQLNEAVRPSGVDNLSVCCAGFPDAGALEAGRASENGPVDIRAIAAAEPAELLASDRTASLIGRLAATADLVLVHTPPLLASADAAPLVRACDGALAVATMATSRSEVEQAREQFRHLRVSLVGSVLVPADEPLRQRSDRIPAEPDAAATAEAQRLGVGPSEHLRSVMRR